MNFRKLLPKGILQPLGRAGLVLAITSLLGMSTAQAAGLGRVVVVGDSLAAGYQNSSLLMTQQPHGFASLVADQAKSDLPLPLIAPPGILPVLQLLGFNELGLPVIERASGMSPGRVNPTEQAFNLAVPGHTAYDALHTRPDGNFLDYTDFVLGLPAFLSPTPALRSQVEWAEALEPDTVLLWLGGNDTLYVAIEGNLDPLTDPEQFAENFDEVIARLAATGARIAVANVTDITIIPYLTPAEQVLGLTASLLSVPVEALPPLLHIYPGDYLNPDGVEAVLSNLPLLPPVDPDLVVDATEVATVQAATDEMNAHIAAKAAEYGAALVDAHALLNDIAANGIVVGGQRLTAAFLGGIFTLDGIHPTNTAHAVLANAFIQALNTKFHTGVPKVSVKQVSTGDPLLFEGVGTPPRALGHPDPSVTAAMKALRAF